LNHLYGLKEFIRQWEEEPHDAAGAEPPLTASAEGHINLDGAPGCIEAYIFPRWHPQFESALEEGVKELVQELIARLDCITYTSCQGHPAAMSGDGARTLTPRHVGILPRNRTEHLYLSGVLTRAAGLANERAAQGHVKAVVRSETLTSEESDRDCLNITFADCGESAEDYFERVEGVYREFINALRAIW
jgi:hypothetical protein